MSDQKQFRSEAARKNYEKAERQRAQAKQRKAQKAQMEELIGKAHSGLPQVEAHLTTPKYSVDSLMFGGRESCREKYFGPSYQICIKRQEILDKFLTFIRSDRQ